MYYSARLKLKECTRAYMVTVAIKLLDGLKTKHSTTLFFYGS